MRYTTVVPFSESAVSIKEKIKSKRKYPACRPKAVADKMSKGQKSAAVRKNRKAGNTGGKPTSIKWSVSPSGRRRKQVRKKK